MSLNTLLHDILCDNTMNLRLLLPLLLSWGVQSSAITGKSTPEIGSPSRAISNLARQNTGLQLKCPGLKNKIHTAPVFCAGSSPVNTTKPATVECRTKADRPSDISAEGMTQRYKRHCSNSRRCPTSPNTPVAPSPGRCPQQCR